MTAEDDSIREWVIWAENRERGIIGMREFSGTKAQAGQAASAVAREANEAQGELVTRFGSQWYSVFREAKHG